MLEYGKCGMVISNLYDRARARSKVPHFNVILIIIHFYSICSLLSNLFIIILIIHRYSNQLFIVILMIILSIMTL